MSNEKWLTQVKKGLLELCLLNLLVKENLHGYELVKRLTQIPGLVVTAGTIYPLLNRLKKESLLSADIEELVVVASRSHGGERLEQYLDALESKVQGMSRTPVGSSLKLCVLAARPSGSNWRPSWVS